MNPLKRKLLLTAALIVGAVIFAFMMHQHIVATSPSPDILETKDDSLSSLCGMVVGIGIVLIWLLPFFQKFAHKFKKS